MQTQGQLGKAPAAGKVAQQKKAGTSKAAAAPAKKPTRKETMTEVQRQAGQAALEKANLKVERMKAKVQPKFGGGPAAAPAGNSGEAMVMQVLKNARTAQQKRNVLTSITFARSAAYGELTCFAEVWVKVRDAQIDVL